MVRHARGGAGRSAAGPAPSGPPRAGRLSAAGGRLRLALTLAWQSGRGLLLASAATEVVAGTAPVASAWLLKVALDRLVHHPSGGSATGVVLPGVGLAVACFASAASQPVLRYLGAELARAVSVRAKQRLYAAVDGIDTLATLEDPAFRDRLRLAEQASQHGPGQVIDSVFGSARTAITLAGMLATAAVIAPMLAVVVVVSAVPALLAEIHLSRRQAAMLWQISPAQRREFFYTELLTSLAAAKETRLFGTGRLFRRRMLAELGAANAAQRRHDRRELAVQGVLAALSAALAGAAMIWALVGAVHGQLTVGDVSVLVAAVGTSVTSLAGIVTRIALAHHAGLLLEHYQAVVDGQPAPDEAATPLPDEAGTPLPAAAPGVPYDGIELDDVWFRYGPDQPWVLRGVCLRIPTGRSLALVGENGSGKSTLVKLLCRFYEPTRGSIRWYGVDLRDMPVADLRRRIGAVFQDFMCYELAAWENIALGDVDGADTLDPGEPRLTEAARRAEVLDAIEALPRGRDTLLSRTFVDYADAGDGGDGGGVLLSGGQWQRLALARALVRGQRDLLILDEPSSGLDAVAEHRIHASLTAHRRGRTSVLISHRLNTVRDADAIAVLEDGRITEYGTHAALLAAAGTYARLFRLQASGYETEPTTEPEPQAEPEAAVGGRSVR